MTTPQPAHANLPDTFASTPLLRVEGLHKQFPIKKGFFNRTVGHVHAVNDVSLDVYPGETLGIVGESGCGKSTLARCILQLIAPSAGHVWFEGHDLPQLSAKALRPIRREMQIIFQNPYSSLDPRMRISDTLKEPFLIHRIARSTALEKEIRSLLDCVGLSQATYDRYPHELSGGQRQRVGIARAIALKPKLIIADEAVSALDVSVQAQILNLLMDLKREFNLTYIFIAHNLSVVEFISDRVAVMYLGQVVEQGPSAEVYHNPLHPYTKALLSAVSVPDPDYDLKNRILLQGDLPSPANLPSGCVFHTRCMYADDTCRSQKQTMIDYAPHHHAARCFKAPSL